MGRILSKETHVFKDGAVGEGLRAVREESLASITLARDSIKSLAQGSTTYVDADGNEITSVIGTRLEQAIARLESVVTGLAGYTRYEQTDGSFTWDLSAALDGLKSAIDSEVAERSRRMSFDEDGLSIGLRDAATGSFVGMRTAIDEDTVAFVTEDGETVAELDATRGLAAPSVAAETVTLGGSYRFQMLGDVLALTYVGGE